MFNELVGLGVQGTDTITISRGERTPTDIPNLLGSVPYITMNRIFFVNLQDYIHILWGSRNKYGTLVKLFRDSTPSSQ